MKLSLPQLVALAQRHGFPNPQLAAAVAMAESRVRGSNPPLADTNALNDTSAQTVFPPGQGPERSLGLWQINVLPGANPQYVEWNLTDPDVNAQAALRVSGSGKNWTPWSTYTSGAYKRYYPTAPMLAETIIVPRRTPTTPVVLAMVAAAALATAAGCVAYLERQRLRI